MVLGAHLRLLFGHQTGLEKTAWAAEGARGHLTPK